MQTSQITTYRQVDSMLQILTSFLLVVCVAGNLKPIIEFIVAKMGDHLKSEPWPAHAHQVKYSTAPCLPQGCNDYHDNNHCAGKLPIMRAAM